MFHSNFYIHESDRKALQALKALPAFTQIFKAFIKVWSESQCRIQNMSTNMRISEEQLPKYYHMLLPICEKLGIDVPELYLELDVVPNAYTAGDTEPFIVITSGLLEAVPEELIPTVLAHECGHIACHHCLYTTMGRFILSEAAQLLDLPDLVMLPVRIAFFYWMRCSELSADRAAALCDGTTDKVVEMCMRFAGYDKNIGEEASMEVFMKQATQYRNMVNDSAWNKTLEFLMLSNKDHPLNAVRALECFEWGQTDKFTKLLRFKEKSDCSEETVATDIGEIPMPEAEKYYIGKNEAEVCTAMQKLGFTRVLSRKNSKGKLLSLEGEVLHIYINGKEGFEVGEWIPVDAEVIVEYYGAMTEEELAATHPGQVRVPVSSYFLFGKPYFQVEEEFRDAGFRLVLTQRVVKEKTGILQFNGSIESISIDGQTEFNKGDWFDKSAVVLIKYNEYV